MSYCQSGIIDAYNEGQLLEILQNPNKYRRAGGTEHKIPVYCITTSTRFIRSYNRRRYKKIIRNILVKIGDFSRMKLRSWGDFIRTRHILIGYWSISSITPVPVPAGELPAWTGHWWRPSICCYMLPVNCRQDICIRYFPVDCNCSAAGIYYKSTTLPHPPTGWRSIFIWFIRSMRWRNRS